MKIFLAATVTPIHNGFAASISCLRLAGHGKSEDAALDSIQRVALTLFKGLEKVGYFETTLNEKRIRYERDGNGITVVVAKATIEPAL